MNGSNHYISAGTAVDGNKTEATGARRLRPFKSNEHQWQRYQHSGSAIRREMRLFAAHGRDGFMDAVGGVSGGRIRPGIAASRVTLKSDDYEVAALHNA